MNSVFAHQRRYKWFLSKKKDSFLSVREQLGKIDIPHHTTEQKDVPFFWNLDKLQHESVACVGCSITYGHGLPHSDKWPSMLSNALQMPTLNFGLTGGGCDIIYVNLKNAMELYNFKTVIINLPDMARRIARLEIEGKWFRWPVVEHALWKDLPPHLNEHNSKIEQRIKKDKTHRYSKKMIIKIIHLCERAKKNYFMSSWDDSTYNFLQTLNLRDKLLPKYLLEGPRIDGFHPTLFQNAKFVSDIKDKL